MKKPKHWLVVLAALVVAAAGPKGSDTDQASYSMLVPLTPVGTAPVQRVRLPIAVLLASKGETLADIRVFDGQGRVVPIARMPDLPSPSRSLSVPAMPILGAQQALQGPDVTLKIEGEGRVRTVTVDGQATPANVANDVIGSLFEPQGLSGEIEQFLLEATIPEGQPVRFKVEASEDLKIWRPLGEAVAYRAPGSTEKDLSIPVVGTLEDATKLRVTWSSEAQVRAPVLVRQARVTASRSTLEAGPLRRVSAKAPPLLDPYSLEFLVPFASPIRTLTVEAKGGEGLVPIQIFGRSSLEEPWWPLRKGRAEANAGAIEIEQRPIRMIRIEADRRVGGFNATPAIRFGLLAPEIAFVTSGKPPFTLATGHPSAADVYLPLGDIARGAPSNIPEAKVQDDPVAELTLAPPSASKAPSQTMVLWAILIGVTFMLAGIAWYLWSNREEDPPPAADPS